MAKQDNAGIFQTQRRLVILTDKSGLGARLQDQLSHCRVGSVASINELLQSCQEQFGCCGVVDLAKLKAASSLHSALIKIHQFATSGRSACLIAITDSENDRESTGRLFQAGLQGITRPDPARIAILATRYWDSVDWPPQNVTESGISNLPWSAIE